MCADANGKVPRRILFRQATPRARLKGEDPEDTSEFPVQALMIAGIRHNRSFIVPPELMANCRRTEAKTSVDEVTRESLPKKRDEIPRAVEMMEIWMVQQRLSNRMRSFFPHLSEIELLGLMCRLEVAARDARVVCDGRSPKQEFFAGLPTDLLAPVRIMYGTLNSAPRAP